MTMSVASREFPRGTKQEKKQPWNPFADLKAKVTGLFGFTKKHVPDMQMGVGAERKVYVPGENGLSVAKTAKEIDSLSRQAQEKHFKAHEVANLARLNDDFRMLNSALLVLESKLKAQGKKLFCIEANHSIITNLSNSYETLPEEVLISKLNWLREAGVFDEELDVKDCLKNVQDRIALTQVTRRDEGFEFEDWDAEEAMGSYSLAQYALSAMKGESKKAQKVFW